MGQETLGHVLPNISQMSDAEISQYTEQLRRQIFEKGERTETD